MSRVVVQGADLAADALYLSPLNRRCRWVPVEPFALQRSVAHFVYDTLEGRPTKSQMAEGFALTPANWRILRRVG